MCLFEVGNLFLLNIVYVFYFDVGLYVKFLCEVVESYGVQCMEGKVIEVCQYLDGVIQLLVLENGSEYGVDFFIDCFGFCVLLIE